jgi:phosphate:Na+ symporter
MYLRRVMGATLWETLDIWRLLAGLGIFLFGMFLLEEGIHALSGQAFQRLLARFTSNPVKAVATGTLATAVMQSSSAVSLMVLAFVGAGVLAMGNAIGVIIGSNLGTTATAWIVATLGFKMNIEALSLPFIGIGGLGLIFLGKRPRYAAICRLLTGFGFLFMGLDYMKNAVTDFTTSVGPSFFDGIPAWAYLLIGIILTAITQSSSASLAIVLSAVYSGITAYHEAALYVIGANIGTTFTVMLGALGGTTIKKQVATSHVFFNWITGAVAVLALPLLLGGVGLLVGDREDPVLRLAVFHTLFNLMGVLLFLPFTGLLGQLVQRIYPLKHRTSTRFISQMPDGVGEAAANALEKEVWHLLSLVLRYHARQLGMLDKSDTPDKESKDADPVTFQQLKEINAEMNTYASRLQQESLSTPQSTRVHKTLFAARMFLFSAKWMRELGKELHHLQQEAPDAPALRPSIQKLQADMVHALRQYGPDKPVLPGAYDQLKDQLKAGNKDAEHTILNQQPFGKHLDNTLLARLLAMQKTWYLAWRNFLLGLRELQGEDSIIEDI